MEGPDGMEADEFVASWGIKNETKCRCQGLAKIMPAVGCLHLFHADALTLSLDVLVGNQSRLFEQCGGHFSHEHQDQSGKQNAGG